MILLEQVSPDFVTACWLKAELTSPRFRPRVLKALKDLHLPLRWIERPALGNRRENLLRQEVLILYRGDTWGTLAYDTPWWRATITSEEFRTLRVINYPTWTLLSRGTGRLSAAAATVAREVVPAGAKGRWAREARAVISHVLRIRKRLNVSDVQARLILIGRPRRKTWTILEGNKRATALYIRHFLTKDEPFPTSIHVLVGLPSQPCPSLRTS